MALDPRQLRHLSTVISEGTFIRAAAVLNVSQPAISKSIQLLERAVGAKLLERGRHGAEPTIFGQALALHSQRIEAELQQAVRDVEELKGVTQGRLKIGATLTATSYIVPLAVIQLTDGKPKVVIEIIEDRSERLIEMLKEAEVDLIVGPVYGENMDDDVVEEFLFNSHLVVALRQGHPLANRATLRLSDLSSYPFVGIRVGSSLSRQVEVLLKSAGMRGFPCGIVTNSVRTAKRIIERSNHFALLPKSQVAGDVRALRTIDLDEPGNAWPIGVRWLRHRSTNPAAEAFIAELKKVSEVAAEHWGDD